MKNLLIAFVFILISLSSIAQSDNVDDRLLTKYSIEELNALKTESPSEYIFINYCIENAWYIQALPKEKMKSNDGRIGKIQIQDLNNINFYSLNVNIVKDDYQFFAIEGTDKMLVIKSKDHILKEIKK
jgi:hypothetical protein